MKKKLFVETLEKLETQQNKDYKFAEILGQAFPNAFEANLLPDNDMIISQIIKLLEVDMEDENKWIDYFVYELDFGKNYKVGMITNEDKSEIDLSSSTMLWKFLKSEKK